MIDLTLKEEDRDSFITKLYLKDDSNKYMIKYASGRIEELDFSISKFNQTLLLMEEQFKKFSEDFFMNNLRIQGRVEAKKLIEALLAMLGVYITVNLPMPELVQIVIVAILSLYSVLYQLEASSIVKYCRATNNIVNLAEKFLGMKDEFKIRITDSKTGNEEDWYLVTLSGIEHISGIGHLEFLSDYLTDDVRLKEKEITEEVLSLRNSL